MATAKSAAESKVYCHDCQTEMSFSGKEIKNGHLCVYDNGSGKIKVFKCKKCFKKNPSLANYQDCEVYSRVVGYLRPVKQWNEGKQVEYKNRATYKVSESYCL